MSRKKAPHLLKNKSLCYNGYCRVLGFHIILWYRAFLDSERKARKQGVTYERRYYSIRWRIIDCGASAYNNVLRIVLAGKTKRKTGLNSVRENARISPFLTPRINNIVPVGVDDLGFLPAGTADI